jgi:cation:H+ antiporter
MEFALFDAFMLALGSMGIGIAMLIYGGNWIVNSAVYIANRFGMSPVVVGFTIVAMGTSLPELVVSVFANLQGSGGLALGNVIGSNIANVLLVIGFTACFIALKSRSKELIRDGSMMLFCTALITGGLLYGEFTRLAGLIMVLLLVCYIGYHSFLALRGEEDMIEDLSEHEREYSKSFMPYIYLLGGIVGIALGAEFLVRGARTSASVIGVPEAVIGLSVVALGTSLPELSTCLIAARKGMYDIIFGNILGSNVFNILMIVGFTALIKPIAAGTFSPQLAEFDIWVMVASSILFFLTVVVFKQIHRLAGFLFFSAYIGYIGYIYAIYLAP